MLPERRLGRTGLKVRSLGLGGIPVRDRDWDTALQVVKLALDRGINFIDTARGYGDSEAKIGAALAGRRSEVYLASKTPARSAAGARRDLMTSLRELKTDYLDLYQLHGVDEEEDLTRCLAPGGALEALREARREGRVRFIGITGHNPRLLRTALKTGEFDTVMVPVNILDRFIFRAEETLLPLARELDVGVIAMKPLGGGVIKEPPLALRYTLSQAVDIAIPGMGSAAEVEENVRLAGSFEPLTPAEYEGLVREVKALGREVCRQCGYCLPCPEGIDIREVFRLEGMYDRYERKREAQALYRELKVLPEACVRCGTCERRCPYDLPIRDKLVRAAAKLGGGT
ncbi:aldo/keto reductase [Gelria sp. Kuro-4]|uniref:aldo/keto reductase n=1 Tax=Gelria sp. Kuro-4 TaxID=2796927 RepID=UPI001BEDAC94|nr:aldo/keto reductase [Gelria sp. Kuro-4]BCV24004.1 aldo/keto reductase [Gelria sp. Kuro-4]